MPAFRARPVVAALVVSLASTACGGGEDIAENEDGSHPVRFDVPPAARCQVPRVALIGHSGRFSQTRLGTRRWLGEATATSSLTALLFGRPM